MPEMIEKVYQCRCGAEDTVKLFPGERTPPAINCWKCKAGRRMELTQMLQGMIGMFPKQESEVKDA